MCTVSLNLFRQLAVYLAPVLPRLAAQAGELLDAIKAGRITAGHVLGEIGDVLDGKVPGRTGADDVTVYKSLGVAAQDLVSALVVYRRALERGLGTRATL